METPHRPDPPLTDETRAQARRRPGGYLYRIDPFFDPDGEVPPFGIEGAWQVDHQGAVLRFAHNPNYRPSPRALGMPEPADPVETALQLAATGYGTEADLLAALQDNPLYVYAEQGQTGPYVPPGPDGRGLLDAFTHPNHLPPSWPGARKVTGRQLAALLLDCDLRLNPGRNPSVVIPIDNIARHDAQATTAPRYPGGPHE